MKEVRVGGLPKHRDEIKAQCRETEFRGEPQGQSVSSATFHIGEFGLPEQPRPELYCERTNKHS